MKENRMFTPADLIFEEKSKEELTEALEGFKEEILKVLEKNTDNLLSLNDKLTLLGINPFILYLSIEKEGIYFDQEIKEWRDKDNNMLTTNDMVDKYLENTDKASVLDKFKNQKYH